MLAGVTDCRRGRKWGCKGKWALGFRPSHGSHRRGPRSSEGKREDCQGSEAEEKDHAVLKERRENHVVLREKKEDHAALAE